MVDFIARLVVRPERVIAQALVGTLLTGVALLRLARRLGRP